MKTYFEFFRIIFMNMIWNKKKEKNYYLRKKAQRINCDYLGKCI